MHKVFISYHHANDQAYKDALLKLNNVHNIFIDMSVDTGDISDALKDEAIRSKIRDEYLRDSSVSIVLAGADTAKRKHVDWEIYSSMYDGMRNKKSGILVINLPSSGSSHSTASHKGEKDFIYPECGSWKSINVRGEYIERYPNMPERIVDNLLAPKVKISVTPWSKINNNPEALRFLINAAFDDREACEYDLSRPMRRSDS